MLCYVMLTTAGSLSHLEAVNADGTAHIHIPITVAGPPVITQVVPSIAVPPTVSVSESISGLVETEAYSAVTLSHAANYSAPTGNELSTAAADDQTVDSSDTESDSEFDMADIKPPTFSGVAYPNHLQQLQQQNQHNCKLYFFTNIKLCMSVHSMSSLISYLMAFSR